jgi:predicted ATPase/Tfp pilus assembly protein PilF
LSSEGTRFHARLIEEGRAQSRLSHDHIVPVLDVLDIGGAPALVMPLIEGPSLAQLLEVHRPSEDEVAAIARGLLAGIEAAHAVGLVHRDLKPSNVLLDLTSGSVQPRICDFGIARSATSDLTHTGGLIGTPAYAAPEQIRNAASADARADLWSLGVMLYEMLTGTLPFRADDLVALVQSMEAESFPALSDPGWRDLVHDLLRARPEARLSDHQEIHNRIHAISPPSDRSPLGPGTQLAAVAWRMGAAGSGSVTVTAEPVPPRRTDSLPRERDEFVGRAAEASTLRASLTRSRLVTMTGPGGVGKTRLAIHVARSLSGDFSGVVFSDLTDARSVDGILYAVANALDVALGRDPVAQLGHAIAGRGRLLVVIDNFEQVVEHAAATIGLWIDRAAEASFLVTSREPLRLRGESVFPLDVLALPEDEARRTIDGSEAVSLFVIRAQQSDPSFHLDEDNAATVARLVRRLDGLPLAIELAAARIRTSTPARLLERLTKRFDLLAGGSRDTSDRQRSLRATLDWSWEQLGPTLQRALVQLSVFDGGWTLEAAEFVLRLDDDSGPVEEVLAELVDRSLVRVTRSASGPPRFGMLVSVQEYAAEKRRGFEAYDGAGVRHRVWFAQFGTREAIDSLDVHGGIERGVALLGELDNVVAACSRAVIAEDGAVAVALLGVAWAVLKDRGPVAVGLDLAVRVAGLSSLSAHERAATWLVLGHALESAGRVDESRMHLEAALALAREVGDRHLESVLLGAVGRSHAMQGRMDEAREHYVAALTVSRELGDHRNEGLVLSYLGGVHNEQGRTDEARRYYHAALTVARTIGNRRSEGVVLTNLGTLHHDQGRIDEAGAEYEAGLAVAREVGDRRLEGIALCNLGAVRRDQRRVDEVEALYDAALALMREVGQRRHEGIALCNLGELCAEQGRMIEARAHYDAALVVARAAGDPRVEGTVLGNLGALLRVLGDHGAATRHLACALALHREIDFTWPQSVWLDALALIDAAAERHDAALALALEAVAVSEPFPAQQVMALMALGRVHLSGGRVSAAREAITRARAMTTRRIAELAAVDALVAVAERDRVAAEAALSEATEAPSECLPGTEVAQLIAQAQRGLDSL